METLSRKTCVPCEGGALPLSREQAQMYLAQTPFWSMKADAKSISRELKRKDFKEAMVFVNKAADIAEKEGHHPDISVHDYKYVSLTLSTHAIGGLSENDFILAAKIDRII